MKGSEYYPFTKTHYMLYVRAHYFNAYCNLMEHFVLNYTSFLYSFTILLCPIYVRHLHDVLCVAHPYVQEEARYTFG
jgi:hypothetical protein